MKYFILCCFVIFNFSVSFSQKLGCTDVLAKNYDAKATINNGSCTYKKVKVKPFKSFILEQKINESSGLLVFDDYLWTHNDDHDMNLYGYAIDSILQVTSDTLKFSKTIPLVSTIDWEAITQDEDYIYLGDFGNNYRGNRTDLQIKKISKIGIYDQSFTAETIEFVYENQFDFSKQKPEHTNFDCEAMVTIDSTLYLFTKQWLNNETTVYKLNKNPGKQTAKANESFKIKGLVTDATYLKEYNLLVICGYTKLLKPFIYLFYDFERDHFFSGNKRRIKLKLPFHQIEGITSTNGLQYFLSNEEFKLAKGIIDVPQKLHILDLSPYLKDYISTFETDK